MISTFAHYQNIHVCIADDLQTWDGIVERLGDHQAKPSKLNGELWSPTIYKPNTTRANINVESVTLFVADLDRVAFEKIAGNIAEYEYIAYTTFSHSELVPHWRVVIRLDRFVPADSWQYFHRQVSWSLFNSNNDPACSDVARIYFFPYHSTDATDFQVIRNNGKLLKVDDFTKKTRVTIAQDATKSLIGDDRAVISKHEIVERYFKEIIAPNASRHDAALRATLALKRKHAPKLELDKIRKSFIESVTADKTRTLDQAEKEWDDMIAGADKIIAKDPTLTDVEPKKPKREGKSIATQLVELAEKIWRFTISEDGRAFAIPLSGAKIARPLNGGRVGFKSDLSSLYFNETGRVANSGVLTDAITVLEGKAQTFDREITYLRSAHLKNEIFVDIGTADGRAIHIVADRGWNIVADAPIIFRRTELIDKLPEPIQNGDIELLRRVVNVNDRSWELLVGWMVSVYLDIPRPILFPTGTQGTGKTASATRVIQTLDRSPAPLSPVPKDLDTWQTIASASLIVGLDNISKISSDFSDALCRAVTGDGMKRRQLYSDASIQVSAFRRPIVITSIDAGAIRGDLGERLLPIPLERIADENRRSDDELTEIYNRHAGEILGGVLDLVAKVLGKLQTIEVANLPRMADFAKVLVSLDEITGWTSFAAYLETIETTAMDVVNTDEVAVAVINFFTKYDRPSWSGEPSELHKLCMPIDFSNTFPKLVSVFGTKLAHVIPALRHAGIEVTKKRHGSGRTIRLEKLEPVTAVTGVTANGTLYLSEVERW